MLRRVFYRPQTLLIVTFGAMIVIGTGLLSLPAAHGRGPIKLVDALFTSTSAVCVTGLITRDTATDFSRFGQVVILVLIQVGGLGIVTFGALAARILQRRLSFSSEAAWHSSYFDQGTRSDLRQTLWQITCATALIEVLGAILLYLTMSGGGADAHWFDATFLAISAYCNAGFSIYSENVMGLNATPAALGVIAALIIVGGLGHAVCLEAFGRAVCALRGRRRFPVVWSLHARTVLRVSALLIVGGTAALLVFGIPGAEGRWFPRIGHALFQSISARTAGFNTIDIGALSVPALLVLILWMFIGGSPGSTAGGVKTTTAAVWLARVRSRLLSREAVTLFERTVPPEVVRRAGLVVALALLWNLTGIMVLSLTEGGAQPVRFEHLMFEQVSAFGTVGLSAGVTAGLSSLGKLWIILTMFMGRLGPLTIALAIFSEPRGGWRYPAERVMIG